MEFFSSKFEILIKWIAESKIRLAITSFIMSQIIFLNYMIGSYIIRRILNRNAAKNQLVEFDEEYDELELFHSIYEKLHHNVESPINIDSQRTITKEIYERLRWSGYKVLPKTMILKNTGKNIVLQAEFDRDGPYVSGANLRTRYDFIELTLKWGWQCNDGSEHMLNFNKFSLELQALHKSGPIMHEGVIGYDNVTMSYFFDKSPKDNVYLNPIFKNLHYVQQPKTQVLIKPFPLERLMYPFQSGFYSYYGTFSDAPHPVYTNWLIYPDQFNVSARQLQQFQQLIRFDGTPMMKTSRLLKPLGQRCVTFNCYNPEEEDIF